MIPVTCYILSVVSILLAGFLWDLGSHQGMVFVVSVLAVMFLFTAAIVSSTEKP